ncbi:hypothetical protein MB02_05165 [Croceicoccus estronivorus]|uniref:hypothetical protein n=1 Tax=Croceicoccus estronivorus TaxID=1172626 RepID=UPI000833F8BE|nr:hypothetical protein [Croceicoccus estronivorus]OCC24852.1 hypothetical protein MB02_05165 [Croceicoccus estronivorus]
MDDQHGNTVARRTAVGLFAGGAAMLLGGCGLSTTRASYRFRMTVVTWSANGSGVLRVNASKSIALTVHEHAGGAGLTGQAVVIDLPTGPVFALLTIGDGKPLLATQVTRALAPGVNTLDASDFLETVDRLESGSGAAKAELPRADWPMMVRFRDLNDSTTVELVDPATIGVRRIVVQTTRDDVTTGLRTRLPWLSNGGLTLDPDARPTITPTFPQMIRQRALTTEIPR